MRVKSVRFEATLLEGGKGAAFEVPFDPQEKWKIPPRTLWPGRRGHEVKGVVNGVRFESAIVPRSRRFFVIVDNGLRRAAALTIGDDAEVILEPRAEPKKPGGKRL